RRTLSRRPLGQDVRRLDGVLVGSVRGSAAERIGGRVGRQCALRVLARLCRVGRSRAGGRVGALAGFGGLVAVVVDGSGFEQAAWPLLRRAVAARLLL